MKFLIRLSILLTLVTIFTVRCASPGSLTGGLRDSLPPVIVRTTPHNYATNFNSKKILIEFNEYVQLKEQQKLFFVSPPGGMKPRLTIKGKVIEALFEEDLEPETTYRLDFGTSIVDNNEGNKMGGYSFVFSTGNYIDSLVMAGQVLGAYERDTVVNAYLSYFAAEADSQEKDSTMFNGKVEGLFRTDSSGYFIADILKDKKYRIYALDDTNGDQKYQPGTDRIGFSEKTYNPAELGDFTLTMDSAKKYMKIDNLQVVFEVFKEIPLRRQLLTKQDRPLRQKIIMVFNSRDAVIDSLELDGIKSEWLKRETGINGDTITYWIAPPSRELVDKLEDTIKGRMLLQKDDSLFNKFMGAEKLTFTHKIFDLKKREKEKEKEKERKLAEQAKNKKRKNRSRKSKNVVDSLNVDSLRTITSTIDSTAIKKAEEDKKKEEEENKFKFTVRAEKILIPENNIVFDFDFPLRRVDTARIELFHNQKIEGKGRDAKEEIKPIKVPFTIENSPNNLRRWIIKSQWKKNESYDLLIPSRVFEDITFESNDTLRSDFVVADPEKFGEFILPTPSDSTDTNRYIFELLQGKSGKMSLISRKLGIKSGETVKFSYLTAGTYYLRIIQDVNGNGKWDTGDLVNRLYPEKVRMVTDKSKENKQFIAKENWQVTENINLKQIFEE